MKTTKRFTADDNLLLLVMKQQAGTIAKAVLEGVMNSRDAGATEIDLKLTADHLEILDNGKGINAVEEVDNFFARMGTPHAMDAEGHSTDAKFGKFRLGRGQLFNYGRNNWRTGPFNLTVDINNTGLDFEHEDDLEPVPGCRIVIDLYERITASEMIHIREEIIRNCKYIDCVLRLNGEVINTPPETCKWTEETDDAYIRINDSHTRGVEFYQQGVFVQTIPAYQVGASGIIVTKKPVALNISRNDVLRSDAVFKRVIAKFKKDTEVRARSKRDLTPAERQSIINALLSGESKWRDNLATKLFLDTTGRSWSVNTLRRLPGQERIQTQPDGSIGYCFAPARDRRADRVMQTDLGIVFDDSLLDDFGFSAETFFEGIDYGLRTAFSHVDLKTLAKGADDRFRLFDPNKQTPIETRVLAALSGVQDFLLRAKSDLTGEHFKYDDKRVLRIGDSEADGWTDGVSYVAFNRAFLERCGTSFGFYDISLLLAHELCHDEEDKATHVHSEEFYELYHNMTCWQAPGFGRAVANAYQSYQKAVEKAAGKLSKSASHQKIKQDAHAANEALLAGAA